MSDLIGELGAAGPVVTDGGWGTQFQALGLEGGACPELWTLTHPGRVERVARAYVEAGSQVILTNTFGANRFVLTRHGAAERVREVNRAGVEASRRAAGGGVKVFASMGPTGVVLELGDVSEEAVEEAFVEQAGALADAGADAIVVETMADLVEARLAVAAARETGLPVVGCMVFDSGKELDRTMMGATPEEAVAALTAAGADVIGTNCGQGIEGMVAICRRLRAATDKPLWAKPNAGLPRLEGDRTVYDQTPEQFAASASGLLDAGVSFVGGCCGTTPAFIEALCARFR